jgi:hypothetical protein
MKLPIALALGLICVGTLATPAKQSSPDAGDEQSLLQADRTLFHVVPDATTLDENRVDPNLIWTDSFGKTRNKAETVLALRSGKRMPPGAGNENPVLEGRLAVRVYSQIGVVQENRDRLYALRVWVKRAEGWRLLIYQAVATGAVASTETGDGTCENPCNAVPFEPRNKDERDVIHAYQAVERAVTAHDSAAWGSHIAGEFFAVTSNSDRPLDKATRMAGLDNQKVAGIAPFPLVSALMFEFGDVMVMTSTQRPERSLPLHVTRVWFKRSGAWLEGYSYQTTIQPVKATR